MSVTKVEHPSVEERRAKGKKTRELTAELELTRAGSRPAIAPTRLRCSRSRTRRVSPTWCRCATAG